MSDLSGHVRSLEWSCHISSELLLISQPHIGAFGLHLEVGEDDKHWRYGLLLLFSTITTGLFLRPYLCIFALNRPMPMKRWLGFSQAWHGRSEQAQLRYFTSITLQWRWWKLPMLWPFVDNPARCCLYGPCIWEHALSLYGKRTLSLETRVILWWSQVAVVWVQGSLKSPSWAWRVSHVWTHIYRYVWSPAMGDILAHKQEET